MSSTKISRTCRVYIYIYVSNLIICFSPRGIKGAETAASQQEVDRHLELGKHFLVNGQLSDALTHYHAAVGKLIKKYSLRNMQFN